MKGETSCQVRRVRVHREHGDYDDYGKSRNRRIYRGYSDRKYDSPSRRRQPWRYDEGYGREDVFYCGRHQYRDFETIGETHMVGMIGMKDHGTGGVNTEVPAQEDTVRTVQEDIARIA